MSKNEFEAAKALLNPGPVVWRRCQKCLKTIEKGQARCPDHPEAIVDYVRDYTDKERELLGVTDPSGVMCIGQE